MSATNYCGICGSIQGTHTAWCERGQRLAEAAPVIPCPFASGDQCMRFIAAQFAELHELELEHDAVTAQLAAAERRLAEAREKWGVLRPSVSGFWQKDRDAALALDRALAEPEKKP